MNPFFIYSTQHRRCRCTICQTTTTTIPNQRLPFYRIHHMGQSYSLVLLLLIHTPHHFCLFNLNFHSFPFKCHLPFKQFSCKPSMVSLVKTKLFLASFVTTLNTIANTVIRVTTLIPGVHQLSRKTPLIIPVQHELLLSPPHIGSSLFSPTYPNYISYS